MISFTSFDDFIEEARTFHGSASPGLMIGASMVELALHSMGRTKNYHALCETERDLPDAVQLLTPCTTGNGRLHVLSLGRFAMTLFRLQNGKGVRIYLDLAKTTGWPHIRRWALQNMGGEKRNRSGWNVKYARRAYPFFPPRPCKCAPFSCVRRHSAP